MHRCLALVLFSLSAVCALSQAVAHTSDPLAVSLAQQSVAALTGGLPVIDVTLSANVTSIAGPDNETGTGIFAAQGRGNSRIDLKLSQGTLSEVRSVSDGIPTGAWAKNGASATPHAQHNCWTDAAWFFPAVSSLTQSANPRFVFKYVGQEQLNGISVQHISVFQANPSDTKGIFQRLSTTDFYLSTTSLLPIALRFNGHADNDMNTNLSNEILFANYQPVNGVRVPFHFQRLINGVVVLDATVTNAVFNTGLPASTFSHP